MYRVLLADDEPWILEGLKASIDWQAEGFIIEATAENGLKADQLLKQSPPDLALIDIRMPGMNGLEVIRRNRDECPDTRFVIISVYSEFEYARAGIDMGVSGYLLKPLEENQLLTLVRRVKSQLDEAGAAKKNDLTFQAPEAEPAASPADYIRRHCCEDLSFIDLCKLFCMSESAMRTLLLRDTGTTFSKYLNQMRMHQAADLLANSEQSINEIAVACGFSDPLYFRKVFKRYYDKTPSEYRSDDP